MGVMEVEKQSLFPVWFLAEHGEADDVDLEAGPKLDAAMPGRKKSGVVVLLGEDEENHQNGRDSAMNMCLISELKI